MLYQSAVELFGIPFVLVVDRKKTTYKDLYSMIWNRVKKLVEHNDKELDLMDTGSSEEEIKKFPFKLCLVTAMGTSCGQCSSSSSCTGCELKCTDSIVKIKENLPSLSIDWDPKILKKYFDKDRAETISLDPSVEKNRATQENNITLTDCLNLFTMNEKLGPNDPWYCPKCKEFQQAMKKFDLWKLPEILVVHLKRFQYSRYSREKLGALVDFPIEGLDLSSVVISKQEKPPIYDLFAVSNHSGGLGGGHYTAYANNSYDKQWYSFNDSSVGKTSEPQIKTSAAYVLLYQRR